MPKAKKNSNNPIPKASEEPKELAKAIHAVAEELGPLYKIEETNDALAELAMALRHLAHAKSMSVIAQFGNEEDRAAAVEYLKSHYYSGKFEEK